MMSHCKRFVTAIAFLVFLASGALSAGSIPRDLLVKLKPSVDSLEGIARVVVGLGKIVGREDRSGMYRVRLLPGKTVEAAMIALRKRASVLQVKAVPPPPPYLGFNPNSVSSIEHRIEEIEAMPESPSKPDADALQAYLYYVKQRAFPYDTIDWAAMQRAAQHRDKMPAVGRTGAAKSAGSSFGPWEFVGPNNLDIPYRVYYGIRPLSGRINAIAYDPVTPTTIYLCGATGGFWKSTDHGVTWTCLADTWEKMPTQSVAIDPSNTSTIYVGTGDFHGSSGYSMGIMKSTDGGATWTNQGRSLFGDTAISRVVVDPERTQTITVTSGRGAAGYGMVYRSTDGGQTWNTAVNVPAVWCGVAYGTLSAGVRTYYAVAGGNGGEIYRSTDGGVTWTAAAKPSGANLDGTVDVAASQVDPSTVYLLSTGDEKIYKSTDKGNTWTDITGSFPGGYNWSQGWYDYHITTGKWGTSDVVYVGLIDIVYSPDGGTTWISMGGPTYSDSAITHNDQHSLAVNPLNPDEVLVGNDGGIFLYTYDPGSATWSSSGLNRALGVTQFYRASWHPTDPNNIIGGTQDNATPESSGDILNWNCVGGGDGGGCAINPVNPLLQYCTVYNLGVYRTADNWATTDYISPDIGNDNAPFVSALTIDPSNPRYVYGGTNYLYRWDENTQAWESRLGGQNLSDGVVNTIAVAPSNGNVIYVGTTDGKVWRTADAGATWSEIDSGLPSRSISIVSVNRTNPNELLVGLSGTGSNHVWRCPDTSASVRTWTPLDGSGVSGLPDIPVDGIVRDYKDNTGTLYVATDVGVFMTSTGGLSWGNATAPLGLPNVQVNDIGLTPGTGYLFAATWGRGMWRVKLPPEIDLKGLTVAPNAIVGGGTAQGTVTIDVEAPPGGVRVNLKSDNRVATPPPYVLVPSGQTSVGFTIRTSSTQAPNLADITATYSGTTQSATLSVNPPGILSLTVNPTSVPGGTPSTGTVTLGAPAPTGGTVVTLAVDNTSVAKVDWGLLIPAGQTAGQFAITTYPVGVSALVTVRAASPGPTKYATLTVSPVLAVAKVSIVPGTVRGGGQATGTVTLTLPAPTDLTVTLSSSNTAVATVPATVVIRKGAKSAGFTVSTLKLKAQKTVKITAAYGSSSQSGQLVVNP